MDKIPILLLAAGSSRRMGQPKQLLPWGKKTLIEHQIETILATGNPGYVVLGSNSNLIIPVIEKSDINIMINNDWENGMGSSISAGIRQLSEYFPSAEGVLIALLDQPLVKPVHLEKMLDLFHPGHQQIIVSQSASGWKGVPALFDRIYFGELKKLKGDEGAKKIIQKYKDNLICIECDDQLEDIDTADTYGKLLKKFLSQF